MEQDESDFLTKLVKEKTGELLDILSPRASMSVAGTMFAALCFKEGLNGEGMAGVLNHIAEAYKKMLGEYEEFEKSQEKSVTETNA